MNAAAGRHLPALDGLRALSVALVLAAHAGLGRLVPGGLGVTVFFFVSGYLITGQLAAEHAAAGRIRMGRFFLRRAVRLLPAATAYVAIGGLVFGALGGSIGRTAWMAALGYGANYAAVFTRALDSHLAGIPHPFTILWSLAVEEHFYLLWPALLALLLGVGGAARPRGRGRAAAALGILVVAELAWRCHLAPLCATHAACGFHPDDRIYKATDTRLDSLAFGALAALLPQRWPRLALPAALALAATLLFRDPFSRDTWRCTVQGAALFVLVPPVAEGTGRIARLLAARPMRLVGRLSYGLYLWHWLALILALRFTRGPAFLPAYAAMTAVFATASWHALERPFMALRHRLRTRQPLRIRQRLRRRASTPEGDPARNPVGRRLATLLVGSGGGQLAALAAAPLLARLYGLHDFGAYGVVAAAVALAASIASLGVDSAILLARDAGERNDAYAASLAAAAVVALLAGAIGLALPLPGCDRRTMLTIAPAVFALGAGRAAANQALALERNRAVAVGRLMRGAGVGAAQLALGLLTPSAFALALGAAIGQGLAALATIVAIGRAGLPRRPGRDNLREIARRHRALLRWSAPQTLLNAIGNAAVPLLLARGFGSEAAGAYALANRVVQIPAATIGEALRQTLLAAMAPLALDETALGALCRRWSTLLLAGFAAACLAFTPLARPLFGFVFGPAWTGAGLLAAMLLAAEGAGIANVPAVTAVVVRTWQRGLFAFGAALLPVRLLALTAPPDATAAVAAWSAVSIVGSLLVTFGVLRRLGRDGGRCAIAREQVA